MTWPDIISGKTFCHYAKIVPFCSKTWSPAFIWYYIRAYKPLILWLLLLHPVFWNHDFLEMVLQDLEYVDKHQLNSNFISNQWVY